MNFVELKEGDKCLVHIDIYQNKLTFIDSYFLIQNCGSLVIFGGWKRTLSSQLALDISWVGHLIFFHFCVYKPKGRQRHTTAASEDRIKNQKRKEL